MAVSKFLQPPALKKNKPEDLLPQPQALKKDLEVEYQPPLTVQSSLQSSCETAEKKGVSMTFN